MIDERTTKRWGGEPYYGLDYEFDPLWFLTPEQLELQERLIEVCHDVIRPNAIEADRTGEYPRTSLKALAELGLLAVIVPEKYGARGENHVGTLMVTETIARYGCPSTALIYMMHMVAVAALVYRARGNSEIQGLLRRIDSDCLVGTASYTDPETGGHFWYPKISSSERVAEGWHVRKKAAFTTSSGFADWYVTQTTSPDFAGDYSDLSVFLLYPDEVTPKPGTWDAMGMHANQSGPLEIDAVIPADRILGWPGDGAASNDEAVDPLAMLMYAGAYNGVALACIDVAKRHATRRAHVQYGRTIADYATTQDVFGGVVADTQASRIYAYTFAKALDDITDGGSWTMYEDDPHVKPRASLTSWSLSAKLLAAGLASRVSDTMLQVCGGRGYTRGAEIERLVRDAKAGWVMAPSNEVTRQMIGRWALFGAEAIDWWNQHIDEPALQNELGKLDREGKQRIIDQLAAQLDAD
ncbi:MAG: acyl-CoA dehydrogenase family protein [Gaiellales bacterium]|jgi:alkylation response protein AidB-like acyl-CoA dehydrogenase|nr:acyl-CoA dehydrogenase family protein [Gaiellales bacterium]